MLTTRSYSIERRRKEKEIDVLKATLMLVTWRAREPVAQRTSQDHTGLPHFVEAVLGLVDDTVPEPAHRTRTPIGHAGTAAARSSPPSPPFTSSHRRTRQAHPDYPQPLFSSRPPGESSPQSAPEPEYSSSYETTSTSYYDSSSATSSQVTLDGYEPVQMVPVSDIDKDPAVLRPRDPLLGGHVNFFAGIPGSSRSKPSGGSETAEQMHHPEPVTPESDEDGPPSTPDSSPAVTEDLSRPGGRRIYRRAEGPPVWVERPKGGRGTDGSDDV